jgi:hypothetical protein
VNVPGILLGSHPVSIMLNNLSMGTMFGQISLEKKTPLKL